MQNIQNIMSFDNKLKFTFDFDGINLCRNYEANFSLFFIIILFFPLFILFFISYFFIFISSLFQWTIVSIAKNLYVCRCSDDYRGSKKSSKIFICLSMKISILTYSWQYFVELLWAICTSFRVITFSFCYTILGLVNNLKGFHTMWERMQTVMHNFPQQI